MKMMEGEPVERAMENYEDSGLTQAHVQAILRTIERHVRSGPAGAFLRGLVLLTVEQGGGWYTRKQIGGAVGLEPDRCTGNVWVSTKLLFEQFGVHQNRLSEGLGGQLLALRHQDGNPHGFRLELVDGSQEVVPFRLEGSALRYRLSDDAPRLSIIGKAHHPGVGTSREHYRKWVFLIPFFVELLLAGLAMVAMALVSIIPLLGAPFVLSNYLTIGAFGAVVIFGIWKRWGRLFDDRVLLLGTNDVAGSKEGVVLDRELVDDKAFMVLRRYVAPCPICRTATVRLSKGEPDFKRRIVGRCSESPREHVYSFDRVTLEGAPLVQRLAIAG